MGRGTHAKKTSMQSIISVDFDFTSPGPSTSATNECSPSNVNLRFNIPKRQYSMQRADSLKRVVTPVFDKSEKLRKDGPSSYKTVLTMAGLFVVGVTLILSSIIVLCQHNDTPFITTACLFLAMGSIMLITCAMLQRKNVVKYVRDLNRDLYFLNMSDSYMWKLMFEERHKLPMPQADHFGKP